MKENSQLKKYKDPKEQIKKIREWTKKNYKTYTFQLHREKDKKIIEKLDNRDCSLADVLRKNIK